MAKMFKYRVLKTNQVTGGLFIFNQFSIMSQCSTHSVQEIFTYNYILTYI